MPLFQRRCLYLLPLAAAAAGFAPDAAGQEPAPQREAVEIEPYDGPAIFLPEGEAPPPPTQVESRVVTEKFPGSEVVRFERRVVRYSDNSVVSDGSHKEFYSSGELYVEGEFDNGVATGTWTYHHPNGQVAKTVEFVGGKPNGEVKVYNAEGKMTAIRRYENGVRSGEWSLFSQDGETRIREDHYEGGKANGLFKVWYPNGQLQREVPFVDGQRDGVAKEYTRTGEPRAEVSFKAGVRDGLTKVWQRDGQIVEQTYREGKLVPGA